MKFVNRGKVMLLVLPHDLYQYVDKGLVNVPREDWRRVRKAWDPALLLSRTLDGYTEVRYTCGKRDFACF